METWTEELPWIGQYVLDERGEPIPATSLLQWGRWMEIAARHVALTVFPGGRVSTIFLGLDVNFWRRPEDVPLDYQPLLWETIVFRGGEIEEQRRYTSRADALEGHRALVKELSGYERAAATCIDFWRVTMRCWKGLR